MATSARRVPLGGHCRTKGDSSSLTGKPSIAVLAFTNMSEDRDQEFFADGIADDIITELSHSRSLFVIARNSSFTYKGRAVDVKQVARELGVRYVVEGSVRRSGSRVRVTAQLVDAETGNHIWAERYNRDVHEVFAVQDEIYAAVANAIVPAIAGAEQAAIAAQAAGEPRCVGGVPTRALAHGQAYRERQMRRRSSSSAVPSRWTPRSPRLMRHLRNRIMSCKMAAYTMNADG